MTTAVSPSDEEIRDFTEHIDVKFKIDDDVFMGKRNIPGKHLMRFAAEFESLSEADIIQDQKAFDNLFAMVLEKESAALFAERLDSEENPIAMTQVMKILPWVMEKYGLRPTEPPSNSSDGSPNQDGGTSSTGNALVPELTSANFPQVNS